MPNGSSLRHLLVGVVFLGGLVLLGYATLAIRGVPWKSAQALTVRFPNVNKLRPGEDVLLHGYRIGQVEDIRYEPDPTGLRSRIAVVCSLKQDLPLTDGATFVIRSTGPLGGQYVEIVPGGGTRVTTAWPAFTGTSDPDALSQIGSLVSENRDAVREILASLRQVAADIESGRGLFGRLVNDPVLAGDFASSIADLREIVRALNSGEGVLGSVIRDQDLRDRFTSAMTDLSTSAAALKEKEHGVLGMLIHDEESRAELKAAITDARAFIRDLREVAADVRSGKGLLGRVVTDEALAHRVQEIADDVHDIVHKVNAGEGTLGQAVNNSEAWDELARILVQAREAIEDLREQAPISTFANVLFSAF